ncbi:hypothetical protein BTI91_04450 [Lactobacillus delbrueckii subsp. bulgaricus]|nr:hypothetical protein [Lactobacillus delbrueckii subsp. bulgaricus]
MAFDGQALNCIFDWWFYHGNPKISIWLDYGGELFFYDNAKNKIVGRVMRLGDGPCFLDYDAKDDPFTDQEHQELVKFVRVNNAKFNN